MQQVHRWFLSAVQQQCRQRLDAFREQRDEDVFAHRSRHRTPISGSIKVRVLTRGKGRCECCGAGCCLANPAPAGPLLPRCAGQLRPPRTSYVFWGLVLISGRMGSGQRTDRDQILITNRSEAAD
jgi:hypothetical protein